MTVTADTSVIVAAFATWHTDHAVAVAAIDGGVRPIGHCLLETYSVLTRLPPPHRASPDVVERFLRARFKRSPLVLPARDQRVMVSQMLAAGISGGAVYDGLVALTAARFHCTLLTLDARAESTYARLAVTYRRP